MSNILHKQFVLKLNNRWKAIEVCTVHDAIVAMCRLHTPKNKGRPYNAIDIDYPNINMPTLDWSGWIQLPVRPQDNYIQGAKQKVRVPTVIIAQNHDKQPEKKTKFSKRAVFKRDGNKCQYTGVELTPETGDIDHVLARDLGGKTEFENVVASLRKINRLKRNMTLEEFTKKFGYKLIRAPFKPGLKKVEIVNTYGIQDWDLFLNNK